MVNTPNVRFNGFTDDWEQRKLGEIVDFLDTQRKPLEGAKRVSGQYPYYGASGIVDYVEGYIFDEELVLLSEDGANITDRNYPISFLVSGKYWVNNHVHVLKTKINYENNFVCNSLERKDYTQYNTGMAMPKLNQEVCRNIPIMCPQYDEQKKIGDYFRNIDHLITLHQHKCDETKELKKYMLQKMFPQKGKKVPEIRFAGFTDDWERSKLEDFGKATGGTSIESEFSENGIYKVISIGSYSENGVYNDQGLRAVVSEKTRNRILNKGDITMILNDKTASGNIIGRVILIEESGVYVYNQRTERIEINTEKYDSLFIYEMLNAPEIRNKIVKQSQGNTQIYVNWPVISLTEYFVPKKEEQGIIGQYFQQLGHLITLHQRKCDQLKEVKKFMLHNMFPQKG